MPWKGFCLPKSVYCCSLIPYERFPKMPVTCLNVIIWEKKKVIIPFLITQWWIMNFDCLFLFFFFYTVSYKQWCPLYPLTELGLNVKYCCNCMTEILMIKLSFDSMRDVAGEAYCMGNISSQINEFSRPFWNFYYSYSQIKHGAEVTFSSWHCVLWNPKRMLSSLTVQARGGGQMPTWHRSPFPPSFCKDGCSWCVP